MKKTLTAVFCLAALGLTSTVALGNTTTHETVDVTPSGLNLTDKMRGTAMKDRWEPEKITQKTAGDTKNAMWAKMKEIKKAKTNVSASHYLLDAATKNLNGFIKRFKDKEANSLYTTEANVQARHIKTLTEDLATNQKKERELYKELSKMPAFIQYLKNIEEEDKKIKDNRDRVDSSKRIKVYYEGVA
jgi:hypothetical protein